MSTQTSVVSLQAPKDVSVSQVEAELSKIWQSYGENSAARASTFNLLVYEPETIGVASRMASVDAIASQSPCRVIDLVTLEGEDQGPPWCVPIQRQQRPHNQVDVGRPGPLIG